MAVRRRNTFNDRDILAIIGRFFDLTDLNEEGGLSYRSLEVMQLEALLPDAFEVDKRLTHRQCQHVFRSALHKCRIDGNASIDYLLKSAVNKAEEILSVRPENYSMWTKFRASQMWKSPGFRLRYEDVMLTTTHKLPKYMQLQEYFFNGFGRIFPDNPPFYGYIIARCKQRSEDAAAQSMLDATDIFFGIYNMYATYGSFRFSGNMRPSAELWHGPFHFIFKDQSFLGKEHLWWNSDYDEQDWKSFEPKMSKVLQILPQVRVALKRLESHPLKTNLIRAIKLLQQGLTAGKPDYSLSRYWSALEQIYGQPNSRDNNSQTVIRRACMMDGGDELLSIKLLHAARTRNEYVHGGELEKEVSVISQFMADTLILHIHRLIFAADKIADLRQWHQMGDLPHDEQELARLSEVIRSKQELLKGYKHQ